MDSIIDKCLDTVFCYKDIHVYRNKNEDNRRVSSCPQPTTSESLAVNMTQQNEKRATGMTTEMTRRSIWRPTYIPINWNKSPMLTNSTSTDVAFGGAWCYRVVAK